MRVRFDNSGKPVAIEPFLTGFLVQMGNGDYGRFGRPCGLVVTKDGSLLISDDMNGVIYRVSYGGERTSQDTGDVSASGAEAYTNSCYCPG